VSLREKKRGKGGDEALVNPRKNAILDISLKCSSQKGGGKKKRGKRAKKHGRGDKTKCIATGYSLHEVSESPR